MAPLKLIGFAAGLLLCCVGLGLLTFASGDGEAVEEDDQLLAQEKMLLEDLQQPDGSSVDDYAAQLEGIISTKIERYMQLQKRLASLKESLAHEETLSARVQKLPMY